MTDRSCQQPAGQGPALAAPAATGHAPAPRPASCEDGGIVLATMTARHLRGVVAVERVTAPRPWPASVFARELEDRVTRRYVVAWRRGPRRLHPRTVVGFAGVQARPDAAHITTIAVHPDHQRCGIGRRLLDWLLAAAVDLGCADVTLEVRAGNLAAQRLYARAGFARAGVRPGYYREPTEDAVIMWCRGLETSGEQAVAGSTAGEPATREGR